MVKRKPSGIAIGSDALLLAPRSLRTAMGFILRANTSCRLHMYMHCILVQIVCMVHAHSLSLMVPHVSRMKKSTRNYDQAAPLPPDELRARRASVIACRTDECSACCNDTQSSSQHLRARRRRQWRCHVRMRRRRRREARSRQRRCRALGNTGRVPAARYQFVGCQGCKLGSRLRHISASLPCTKKDAADNEQQHAPPGGTSEGCDGDPGSRAAPPS